MKAVLPVAALTLGIATVVAAERPPFATNLLDPGTAGTVMSHGALPRAGADATETFGIRLADGGDGIERAGDLICVADALPVEAGDGCVWIEAEAAEGMVARWVPEVEDVRNDADCSGGRYVVDPAFLCLPFRVATAGAREVWIRVRGEKARHPVCHWGIDGEKRTLPSPWAGEKGAPKSEATGGKEGAAPEEGLAPWRWVKGASRNLAAGEHRLCVQQIGRFPFHVDAVALVKPGGPAPAEAPAPSSVRAERPKRGIVETRDVTPPAVAGAVRVDAIGEVKGGSVSFAASLDGGAMWHPISDGDLSGLPIRGDGTDTFRFRIMLGRAPNGASPELRGITLAAKPKPEAWLVLRNDFLRVVVDGRTGRLFRLTDVANDRELVWPDRAMSLFAIDLKRIGEARWLRYSDEATQWVGLKTDDRGRSVEELTATRDEGLDPRQSEALAGATARPARYLGGRIEGGAMSLEFAIEEKTRLRMDIALDTTGQSLWTAAIDNAHPALDVVRLRFPSLPAIRLGESGADDREQRMQTVQQRAPRPGWAPLRDVSYPGQATLPFESLHDGEGGLGVTSRDPKFAHTGFCALPDAPFGETFSFGFQKRDRVRANGGRVSWEYAVAVHPGEWHWVADRYREWAVAHMARPRYPDWFAASDGYFFWGLMNSKIPFAQMGDLARQARRIGLGHVQVWGQFTDQRRQCCGPFWQPSPRYGSPEDFINGIADIHEQGCRIGFYFLHDRVDLYEARGGYMYGFIAKSEYPRGTEFPQEALFEKIQLVESPDGKTRGYPLSAADWAAYERGVKAHREDPARNPPPTRWQPVDQSDPAWWEYMRHWAVDKYVQEWGADGVYYDVLGTGDARESFDMRKDHHGTSILGAGKQGIPRTTVTGARERGHKDFFLLQEGASDLSGQFTASINTTLYQNETEPIRYTWPDHILFDDHAGQGSHELRRVVDKGWLNGNRWGIRIVDGSMSAPVDARARIRDWIYRARFLDTIGIESPVPARLFLRREPGATGATVTFLNENGGAGVASLDARRVGDVRRAIAVDDGGGTSPVRLQREADKIMVPISSARRSAVILAGDVDLSSGVIAGLVIERGDESGDRPAWKMIVAVANLAGAPVVGQVIGRNFGELWLAPSPLAFTCPPGEVVRIERPLDGKNAMGRFFRPEIEVLAGKSVVARAASSSFPPFEDPSFEEAGNEDRVAAAGAKSLRLDPSEGYSSQRFPLQLKPWRRYRVSLAYRRTPGTDKGSFAQIMKTLPTGGSERVAVLRFAKDDTWDRAQAEFATDADFVAASLFVYNTASRRTLWIDDVRVEDIGPAPRP